jgi:hypothetical protein
MARSTSATVTFNLLDEFGEIQQDIIPAPVQKNDGAFGFYFRFCSYKAGCAKGFSTGSAEEPAGVAAFSVQIGVHPVPVLALSLTALPSLPARHRLFFNGSTMYFFFIR